jgi:hypothetical protein
MDATGSRHDGQQNGRGNARFARLCLEFGHSPGIVGFKSDITPTRPDHPDMQGEARFFLSSDRL